MTSDRPASRFGRSFVGGDRRKDSGFLLVEALATLAISAVILAALGSLLGLMSRQSDGVASRTERLDVANHGLTAIARDLGSAARARWDGPRPRTFVFSGMPDRVLFALDREDQSLGVETVAVLIQNSRTTSGNTVLRAEAPLSPLVRGSDNLNFGLQGTLYTGAAQLRFAYVAPASGSGPELLLDAWPAGATLPIAVRVAFTDPDSGDVLSSLRVPLQIDGEAGCAAPRKAFCSRVDERSLVEGPGVSGLNAGNDSAARRLR